MGNYLNFLGKNWAEIWITYEDLYWSIKGYLSRYKSIFTESLREKIVYYVQNKGESALV